MQRLVQQLKRFGDDERAVSPVVGFVLIFALVMIVFTIYNADVVPAQNEQVEYEHGQTIEGQMEELTAAVISAGPDSSPRSVRLQLGVEYPSRALGINPGSPVGGLGTSETYDIAIEGMGGTATLPTSFINYRPTYNLRSERTTLSIQNGMLVKEFSNGNTLLAADGGLFPANESRIDLPLMQGDLQENQMSTIVTPSGVTRHTINVTSDDATLHLPTTLTDEQWTAIADRTGQVESATVTDGPGTIRTAHLDLEAGVAIRANLEAVGDYESNGSDALGLEPRITNVSDRSINATNGTTNLTVRTTDIFGSTLDDVDVELSTSGDGNLTPSAATSGSDGKIAITYESASTDLGSTVDVTASLPNRSGENSSVTFELSFPAPSSDDTANESSREPLHVAPGSLQQDPTDLIFRINPSGRTSIAGFSVRTKGNLDGLNETVPANAFHIYTTNYQRGVPGSASGLHYTSLEPIQFDGEEYTFAGGPLDVTSSLVQLNKFDAGDGATFTGITDSYEDADIIVYFTLADGTKRPVYITATMDGGG